jgi:oxepin-CoA hydrolase/3-oxo-5,6-dehydrosuberyl-CoA semialdehyde dehydrogenase
MTDLLRSYVCGQWMAGEGEGQPLYNPTSEEVLATCSTRGLDFAACLAFARSRGGPALQALTFAQRGEILAAMAKSIHAQRDELIELAIQNGGNTRSDAKFDIDGASFTLSHYAKLAQGLGAQHLLGDADDWARARGLPACTCWSPSRASPYTSMPSISPPGDSPRRLPWPCSPGFRW